MSLIEKIIEIKGLCTRDFGTVIQVNEIQKNIIFKNYISDILTKHFNLNWFIELKKSNFFNFNEIESIYIIKNDLGKEIVIKPNWAPQWLINKAGKYNVDNPNENLTAILENLIDDYITFVNNNDNELRNDRHDTFYFEIILDLPIERISDYYFNYLIENGIKKNDFYLGHIISYDFLDKVITNKNQKLLRKLLFLFFDFEFNKETAQINCFFKGDELENLQKFALDIWQILGKESIEILLIKLKEIDKKKKYEFSRINIVSIADDDQNYSTDTISFQLIILLREILLIAETEIVLNFLIDFFNGNIAILKRIAVYIINKRYELKEFKSLFWSLMNPLNIEESDLEIFNLLSENCINFNEIELNKIITYIKDYNFEPYGNYTAEENINFRKYKQLEWLQAFKNKNLIPSNDKIEEFEIQLNKQLENPKISHPFYATYTSGLRPSGNFPDETNRLFNLKLNEIIENLKSELIPNGYDKYALENDIKIAFNNKFTEILENIEILEHIRLNYIALFIDVIQSKIKDDVTFDINSVFCFVKILSSKREGIYEFNKVDKNDLKSFWTSILWLFTDISKKNNYIFSNSNLDIAIEVVLKLANNYPSELKHIEKSGELDRIINLLEGKIFLTLIELSNVNHDSNNKIWNYKIKDFFNHKLNETQLDHAFYSILSLRIPNINYLDANWLNSNKNKIFLDNSLNNHFTFRIFISYSKTVYIDVFENLFDIYEIMLGKLNDDSPSTQKLIEHITVANFFFENQKILFRKIITNQKYFHLKALIHHIAYTDWYFKEEYENEISEIWEKLNKIILENYTQKKELKWSELFSNIILWLGAFDSFTPKIIELAIFAANNTSNIDWKIIRTLKKKLVNNEKLIGHFLVHTIHKMDKLGFYEREMIEITKAIYKTGNIEIGNQIVESTIEQSVFYLVDLYEEFNSDLL